MFRFLRTRLARFLSPSRPLCSAESWTRDPLLHPDIRRMSERDRADLPFETARPHLPRE